MHRLLYVRCSHPHQRQLLSRLDGYGNGHPRVTISLLFR